MNFLKFSFRQSEKDCVVLPESERRAFGRTSLPLAGMATFNSQGQTVQNEIEAKDVSSTGGYFVADLSPAVGDAVQLFLRWPPEGEKLELTLTATAVVLRVEPLAENNCGFAVKFEGNPSFTDV